MIDFLLSIENSVADAIRAQLPNVQVLVREVNEPRETQSVGVHAQIGREYIVGSRIFEANIEVELRVNRSEYDAIETQTEFGNLFAALCNTSKEDLSTADVTFLSWFPQSTSGAWAEDVSVQTISVRTHVAPVA
jgi:hypothetical protein